MGVGDAVATWECGCVKGLSAYGGLGLGYYNFEADGGFSDDGVEPVLSPDCMFLTNHAG